MNLRDKLKFWIMLSNYVDMIVRGTSPLSLPNAIANSLSYVKAFGGTEQRNLPDGYIERQFIYMMDGSYLLTDIVPTFAGHYELDMQTTSVTGTPTTYLGGRNESSGNGGLRFAHISDKSFRILGFGNASTLSNTAANNTKYKFIWDNGSFWVYSGTTLIYSETFTEETLPTTTPLAINGWNSGGTISTNNEGIYLYSFKAWNAQGELVADYVPAVQKGTVPVVGLYDTVSGTFKTATAGTFAASSEAVPTPDAPMDIISNNGVLKASRNLFNVSANPLEQGGIASNDGQNTTSSYGQRVRTNGYVPVKPSTVYTASVKDLQIYYLEYAQDTTYTNRHASGFDDNSVTFTTGANTYFIRLQFRKSDNSDITPSEVTNVQLEQGSTATPYTPYSPTGIYTDGTVETIWSHTKNLFDEVYPNLTSSLKYMAIYIGDGKFTCSYSMPNQNNNVSLVYFLPGNVSSGANNGGNQVDAEHPRTVTAVNGYVTIAYRNGNSINLSGKTPEDYNCMIEKGSTATTYAPYYDGGTATAEILLKVGDYQDVQSIIDGVVTRNVGVKVLDGTESWSVATTNVLQADILPNDAYGQTCICSHLEYTTSSTLSGMPENSFRNGSATYKNRLYVKSSTLATDATTWTNYLKAQYAAGTPVIVIYPLATPTTESVTGQTLQVTDGDNVLEITQASLSNLELECKYKKQA